MRLFKKIAVTAAAVMIAAGAAQAADKVRIGTEGAYPPFNELTADGKLVGFDIDMANALCEEMKAECEFVVQDWDGMIPALIAGKFDAVIASMSITPDRLKKVDFSKKYYNTPPALAVAKDSTLKSDLSDLAGKTVGAQSSTTHSEFAEQKLEGVDVKLYPTPDEYKLDLVAGRLDAVVDDIIVLSDWLKTDDGACCKILTPLANPFPKFTAKALASRFARAKPSWLISSPPRLLRSARMANTKRSTTNTLRLTFTATKVRH